MNFELFIAKRIISKEDGKKNQTKPLVAASTAAIALGISVMIISVAILTGFKREITQKLVGFSSHIQVVNWDNNTSFETEPIAIDTILDEKFQNEQRVYHYQRFAIKAGIIKMPKALQGVVLKGIDSTYNFTFLNQFLIEGEIPAYSLSEANMGVVISKWLANKLALEIGDRLPTYFIQDPPAARPFRVAAIYNTGLEEYDARFVFCDIRHIQRISGWLSNQITGYEILLNSEKEITEIKDDLLDYSLSSLAQKGPALDIQTVQEISSGFFDFLKLTDTNVWVILSLMMLVSGFNMVSGLLILIINRTSMIGILKALGASTKSLRKIFLIQAAYIVGIGLLIGNLIGIFLCLVQDRLALISLDPESYFVESVPINLQVFPLVLLNLSALVITILLLIIPSGVISKISPAKTIKFD